MVDERDKALRVLFVGEQLNVVGEGSSGEVVRRVCQHDDKRVGLSGRLVFDQNGIGCTRGE